MPTIPSEFVFYCASIVSSNIVFFEFIVLVIVPTIPSKFVLDCASIVSSKRPFFEFIVLVIVPTLDQNLNFIVPLLCLVI